jgi:hypothetical protein
MRCSQFRLHVRLYSGVQSTKRRHSHAGPSPKQKIRDTTHSLFGRSEESPKNRKEHKTENGESQAGVAHGGIVTHRVGSL